MEKDDIPLAFLRHSTSKIRSTDDLLGVTSLGFRGEALSSISAVSMVELITKTRENALGSRCYLEGGVQKSLEEIGAPDGTTFIIRNLFYNTPARKKFLRTEMTEAAAIHEMMTHLALSHPEISFKVIINNQMKLQTAGNGNLKEVIYRIYGRDISENLLPVDCEAQGIRITGFVGKPELNRSNRNFEIYFVNHRYIRSAVVSRAIEEAYKPFLMQHKYPFCVLSIEIAADEIDVNVHPSKMEIRFIRQMEFYDMMSHSISEALRGKELIPEVVLDEKEHNLAVEAEKKALTKDAPEPFEKSRLPERMIPVTQPKANITSKALTLLPKEEEDSFFVAESSPEYVVAQPATQEHTEMTENVNTSEEDAFFTSTGDKPQAVPVPTQTEETVAPQQSTLQAGTPQIIVENPVIENPVQMELFTDKLLSRETVKEHRILGQIFDTYWLVAFQDKLFIIDQHAAHEKVKFERLMKHLQEKEVPSQMLNPPIILTLNSRNRGILEEYQDSFAGLGFEIEEFGGNEFAIRAVPLDLYGCDEKQLFEEVLDELADGPVKGAPDVIYSKLASMACKSAVKGNTKLSMLEAKELIDELLTLENPYHCPHGRPTIISMSKYEIEKKFKRIVT